MESWEKVKTVSGVVATVLIPLAVVLVGQEYSRATKEREIGAKYVELAIGILRTPPSDDYYDVRAWAVEVVDRHSGVKLTSTQKEHLKRTGVLEDVAMELGALPSQADDTPRSSDPPNPSVPGQVTVPNVRGLTVLDAREMFRSAGLILHGGGQSDTAIVDTQQPAAGTRVSSGTTAQVVVAQRALLPRSRLPDTRVLRN